MVKEKDIELIIQLGHFLVELGFQIELENLTGLLKLGLSKSMIQTKRN